MGVHAGATGTAPLGSDERQAVHSGPLQGQHHCDKLPHAERSPKVPRWPGEALALSLGHQAHRRLSTVADTRLAPGDVQ